MSTAAANRAKRRAAQAGQLCNLKIDLSVARAEIDRTAWAGALDAMMDAKRLLAVAAELAAEKSPELAVLYATGRDELWNTVLYFQDRVEVPF